MGIVSSALASQPWRADPPIQHGVKKWRPGVDEPVYDDGNPERMDFVNKDGIHITAYCWAANPAQAKLRHGSKRPSVLLLHGNDSHIRYDYLLHSEEYTSAELASLLQVEKKKRKKSGKDKLTPLGKNQWSEDNSSSRKFRPMKYFDPKYEGSWIETLVAEGYNVYGMDFQSYGLSESAYGEMREVFNRFDDHVDDIIQFREHIRHHSKHTSDEDPLFLLGVSMGGGVALRVCQTLPPDSFAGAILLAPLVSLENTKKEPSNKLFMPLLGCLASTVPSWRVGVSAPNELFPEEEQSKNKDPLIYRNNTRAVVARELIRAADAIQENIKHINVPFLLYHSVDDTLVDPEGATFLFENATSSDKTLKLLKTGMCHFLQHESGNRKILFESIEWINHRAASGNGIVSSVSNRTSSTTKEELEQLETML